MLDFLLKNIEINLLILFFIIAFICFVSIKNDYIHEKIKGWIYIILFSFLLFINNITLILSLIIIGTVAIYEFIKVLKFSLIKNIIYGSIFLFLLIGFLYFMYMKVNLFFYLFIILSFSDIIAYFVGKGITWKKGFTKLSPNKSLSGVIAQIFFIFIILINILVFILEINIFYSLFISLFIGFLGPIGDLIESYFKRKSGIKDMANYIPGHGGLLDRIDSIFLSAGIVGLIYFFISF
ncbi:phosphatidate cytidylyltransferase [Candidatus Vampirococcus lugosii]|uniref:Phosphatidate cytidylyltransferase n=1 Tax=Candidatus Vampirococcus lugosii TaxID=2789015 RepID=A0ABS5QKR4_9BACT|nr:phosphatidate cytidylyltransferase [Candidatus Vampirococcus lugosii]MBS8121815.1 putative CDP-diglyceride synthetase/phosphatidate cytidylyltransferase [Candidatus Vampirococcus lugosii]